MRGGSPLLRLVLLAVLLVGCLFAASAGAAGPRGSGRLVVSLPGGRPAPLQLAPGQGGWVGTFTLTNVGETPLVISRLAIRGDEDDVRAPARVSVRFVDGAATSATLAPGASRDAIVAWMPERDPRARQAFGHVIVTSTDEAAGEVAVGFRAQMPTGLGWVGEHALSWLVALPLLFVALVAGARAAGPRDDPWIGRAAVGAAALQLVVAGWVFARFAPEVVRADGNDGFQLVERAVWVRSIGAEWYVGVDGLSVALLPLAALVWLVAVVVAPDERRGGREPRRAPRSWPRRSRRPSSRSISPSSSRRGSACCSRSCSCSARPAGRGALTRRPSSAPTGPSAARRCSRRSRRCRRRRARPSSSTGRPWPTRSRSPSSPARRSPRASRSSGCRSSRRSGRSCSWPQRSRRRWCPSTGGSPRRSTR